MSFCLRPNVCKKCGKPLTMFEGWTCLECEKAEKESILDKIRAEIESKEMIETTSEREFYNMALNDVLQIIDKYKAESEDKDETDN